MSNDLEISTGTRPAITCREADKRLLASLTTLLGAAPSERVREFNTEWGYDCEVVGYSLPAADGPALAEARQLIQRSLAPCPEEIVRAELARLRIAVANRPEADDNRVLRLQVFGEILASYPADAVVEAMRAWSAANKFWPTEAELRGELDKRVRDRRLLLKALDAVPRGTE